MLDSLITAVVLILPVAALWDYGRRRLDSHNARGDKLIAQAAELKAIAEVVAGRSEWYERKLEDSQDFTRSLLASFINSMTDIISISEEEKRHLRNKLAVAPKPRP